VYPIKSDAFHNWDKFQGMFYFKKGAKISTYHYFRFIQNNVQLKTTVLAEDAKIYKAGKKQLMQKKRHEWRAEPVPRCRGSPRSSTD
jgi:hypothetical protein